VAGGQRPLAYLFWHWPRAETARDAYERDLVAFHAALRAAGPRGFLDSTTFRVADPPFGSRRGGYEDWYLVDDLAALGVLEVAAVAGTAGVGERHDRAARAAGTGTAGLYGLRAGRPGLGSGVAHWFPKPDGMDDEDLAELLQPVLASGGGAGAALWQRKLTLGPAAEFCLAAAGRLELPAELEVLAVSRTRLPDRA
jgi:hypothetical protein